MTEENVRMSYTGQLEVARATYMELPESCVTRDIDEYAQCVVDTDPKIALEATNNYNGFPLPWALIVVMYAYHISGGQPKADEMVGAFTWSRTAEGHGYWEDVERAAQLDLVPELRDENLRNIVPLPEETAKIARQWWKKLGYPELADKIQ